MSTVTVARGLQTGSDERSMTYDELDATASMSFKEANVLYDSQFMRMKALEPGAVSHDFPIFGETPEDADHHVPGQFVEGGTITNDMVNVSLDDPLIKALRLPFVDQAISKWDLVKPYVKECVRKISEKVDKRGFVVLGLAARTAAVSNVHLGGTVVSRTGAASLAAHYPVSDTGADNFCSDLSDMARKFDEKSVPKDGRFVFVHPYLKQVLTRSKRITNRDYAGSGGTPSVDINTRVVGIVEGFNLIETLHLPSTNITTDLSKYNGNFLISGTGQPAALCLYNGNEKGPIGCVNIGGLTTRVVWDENRECWLAKAKILCGLGKVETWCAGEIRIGT